MNNLLNDKNDALPTHNDPLDLSNRFAYFFVKKIQKIRDDLDKNINSNGNINHPQQLNNVHPFNKFQRVSTDDVRKFIFTSSNASCTLDSQPTWLLKENIHQHLDILTNIVNSSLSSGSFP